ncbi:MAG: hypothetical protein K8S16_13215, partial [Bacteroidales bacterium]|nr:hypothetical protein [Bacteroidales bacterium]
GTDVICSNYKWTAGLIDVESGGSFTANDLLDNGIFGIYVISSGGTVNLTNYDGYVDLNGDVFIGDGTMNIYGGTTPSYWPYANNASITMTDGILDFHDQGIYVYDAAPYHLTEDITGGTIRTAGGFFGETNEFTPDYGTMEFYGSTDEFISTENGCYLNNVVINKSNTLTISAPPILHIYGNLTINSGVLNTNGNDIEIKGDWTNNVGDAGFIESTGFVAFSGDTNVTIFSDETFNDLTVFKTISGVYLAQGITINTNNINAMIGDLIFNINSHANIAGDISIHDSYWTLNDNSSINVAGDVTNSGFIDASQGTNIEITVGGNWTDNWSTQIGFISGGETFTINGNSDQIFSTDYIDMYFNNLTINKTGGSFRPYDHLVVYGDLNITTGDWIDNTAGLNHYFYGDFTIGSSGNYYPDGATMFEGAYNQYYQNNGGTGFFKHIYLHKTSGSSLILNSNMVVFMGKTTVIEEGTLNLNGHLYKATGNVYIVPGGNIIVDAGASLSLGELLEVNYGGQLTAIGEPGNNARIYNDGAGEDYSIKIYDGTISADYATFEDLSAEGLRVHDGAFVDPVYSFNNCSFDGYTDPGGSTWLRIENDQNLTIDNISFPNNPGGPLATNIGKNMDHGHITLTNASGAFSGPMYEDDPWNRIDWVAQEIELDITVFLEGPYNGTNMNTGLNDLSILPLFQPYNTAPWNYGGTESVPSIPDVNIVDWLLVELRDAPNAVSATSATIVEQQASFLLNDGSLVGLDGSSILSFNHSIIQSLFVVIWHRNHLGIMSANPITESGGVYTYNFTTPAGQAYGTNAQKNLGGGMYGMFGSDANADGDVNINDKTNWANHAGTQGYNSGDFNLDSQINNPDKNDYWLPNVGESSQVPD